MDAGATEDHIIELYRRYRADLERVRAEQAELYRSAGYGPKNRPGASGLDRVAGSIRRGLRRLLKRADLRPQLDDLEAEITYLRLREAKPRTVVEISPCGGWSSCWILRALRDNGGGELHSYDLIDLSTRNVPEDLARGRWNFNQGDVTRALEALPASIDYLFIDSDHSARFARWYLENLMPRLRNGVAATIHDVFHTADAGSFDSEGPVVMDWLARSGRPWTTASKAKNPAFFERLYGVKRELGLEPLIHNCDRNSMVFFEI